MLKLNHSKYRNLSRATLSSLLIFFTAQNCYADDAKIVQYYLNKLGFEAGTVDGIIGAKTKSAYQKFSSSIGNKERLKDLQAAKSSIVKEVRRQSLDGAHFGLCDASNSTNRSDSASLAQNFNLDAHKYVRTYIPPYRSFSFGTTDTKIGQATHPEIKAIGDINSDGIDDLILEYYETFIAPVIAFGTPSGKFQVKPMKDQSARRRHIRNAELVDLNADGSLDFVGFTTGDDGEWWKYENGDPRGFGVPNGEADILLINDGSGNFTPFDIPEEHAHAWNHGGTAADVDLDGLVDVISLVESTASPTKSSKFMRNQGSNKFEFVGTGLSRAVSKYGTSDIDTGDFNNDGHPDFVVTIKDGDMTPEINNALGTLRVIYGDGDFDFRDNLEVKFGTSWITSEEISEVVAISDRKPVAHLVDRSDVRPVTGSGNVEVIDVDQDGLDDILEGQYVSPYGLWLGNGFKYYRNTGDCFYDATAEYFPNQITNRNYRENAYTSYTHNFYQADLNNDGLKDIILQSDGPGYNIEIISDPMNWHKSAYASGYPYIFIQQQDKSFLPLPRDREDVVKHLFFLDDLVTGDFNGDGKVDLVGIRRPPFEDPLAGEYAFLHVFLAPN